MPAEGRDEATFSLRKGEKVKHIRKTNLGDETGQHVVQQGSSKLSTVFRGRSPALRLAQISVFSALIVVGTTILRIPLPSPLFEVTFAPSFYFAIAVLYPRKVSFWSTAIGSAIGEAFNIAFQASSVIFIPGIVWARAPEVLIIYHFRNKSRRFLALGMVLATVYETLAFFVPDGLFYAYALLSYSDNPQGLAAGFLSALPDIGTLVDAAFIPIALGIIIAVRRAFNTRFLD